MYVAWHTLHPVTIYTVNVLDSITSHCSGKWVHAPPPYFSRRNKDRTQESSSNWASIQYIHVHVHVHVCCRQYPVVHKSNGKEHKADGLPTAWSLRDLVNNNYYYFIISDSKSSYIVLASYFAPMGITPLEPTPTGMWSKRDWNKNNNKIKII